MSEKSKESDSHCSVDRETSEEESSNKFNFDKLPPEMIIEIFSKVTEFKDLRNLLGIPEIREFVFKTPDCMRRVKIVFGNKIQQKNIAKFLTEKGIFLKIIMIGTDSRSYEKNDPKLIPFILTQTPNLEEFIHDYNTDNFQVRHDEIVNFPFSLPHLKHLMIGGDFWENFITNAKEIHKLESLKLSRFSNKFNQNLTTLLCEQLNLKELSLEYFSPHYSSEPFPSWNINNQISFKLKKFKYRLLSADKPNEHLYQFLESQVESLHELELEDFLESKFYKLIFEKCLKLEKLILIPKISFDFKPEIYEHWNCKNLTYFETIKVDEQVFSFMQGKLPKLETTKCRSLIWFNLETYPFGSDYIFENEDDFIQ